MSNGNAGVVFRKIAGPLIVSVTAGLIFFFAGDAYQAVGLAALDKGQLIISYTLGITLFLSVAVLVERVTRYVIFGTIVSAALGTPVPRLLIQLSSILIYLVALGAILSIIFKKDLTVLWAASGVAGVVLGMALRELLLDIFCGLALNIDRPVRIGDYVQLHRSGDATVEGRMLEISWRTTRIEDLSGNIIIVPNNRLSSATITNFSQPRPYLQTTLMIPIDVTVPHERAMRILLAAATEASAHYRAEGEPVPTVSIKAVTPEAVEYFIVYACELPRRSRARNLILQHVLRHLRQAGLRPALPKSEAVDPAATHWQSERPTEVQMRHVLRSADLFLDLSDAELDLLARQARMQILPPDQTVVHAGEVGTAAYILVEGLLESTRGRDTEATLLRPGDLFGAAAALLGDAHAATVRSRTSAMVCQLDMEAFQALFSHDPEAVRKVALRVAEIMKRDVQASGRGLALSVNVNEMAEDVLRTLRRTFSDMSVSGAWKARIESDETHRVSTVES